MKRFLSLLLAAILILGLPVSALAEDADQTQTITEGDQGDTDSTQTTEHTHSWGEGVQTTAPTCTQPGVRTFTCSCGESRTEEIAATGTHTYVGTKVDDSTHQLVCSGCGDNKTGEHTWNAGTVTTPATCLATGVKTYTCTACPAEKTEAIPLADHSFGEWTTTDTDHSRICGVCDEVDEGNHNWDKGTVKKEATCKETGSKEFKCKVCGKVRTEVLAKLTTHTYDNDCDKDCNVCEKKRDVSHKFTTVWSKNYTGHWHECTKCGEQKDFAKHIPGPPATEESEQVCLTCDYVLMPKKDHIHDYSKEWSSDDSGHWYACESCAGEKDFGNHVFDDPCDDDCSVCGYVREDSHTYPETWETTEHKHWQVCSVCGEKTPQENHVPGPEATEDTPQLCTVCGYEICAVAAHVHSYGPGWEYSETGHWQSCPCGEDTVPYPHTWDEGVKNKDKTITFTCTECRMERVEESRGFPWWVLIVLVLFAAAGGAAWYVFYLLPAKDNGKYSRKD